MRYTATLFCLGLLAASLGCESTRWAWLKSDSKPRNPAAESGAPSVASLVDYLNDNARRVETLSVRDLDLTCTQGVQSFGLVGQMAVQKPRNFRMGAKTLGNPVVDLGSNDQEFWYWISKAPKPYQFFCNYKDMNAGRVRMPIPFQPEWIMEAMGFGPYGPPEKYKMEHDAKHIRLVEHTTSPQGTPVRKVIVFARKPATAPQPQVTEYLLLEEAGRKEICAARITEVQIDRQTGAIVPRRIELRYPAEELRLAMKLDSIVVNQPSAASVFARLTMPGVQSFNLATMQIDNSPPAQAFSSAADSKLKTVQGFGE